MCTYFLVHWMMKLLLLLCLLLSALLLCWMLVDALIFYLLLFTTMLLQIYKSSFPALWYTSCDPTVFMDWGIVCIHYMFTPLCCSLTLSHNHANANTHLNGFAWFQHRVVHSCNDYNYISTS